MTVRLGGKERLEGAFQGFGGHPGAGIGNGDRDKVAGQPVIVGAVAQSGVAQVDRQDAPLGIIASLALLAMLRMASTNWS